MPKHDEVIRRDEFDAATTRMCDGLANYFQDQEMMTLDYDAAAKSYYNDNLTSILNELIRLNSKFSAAEIKTVYAAHSRQLLGLSNFLKLISETEL